MSTAEGRISLRVKVRVDDDTAIMEMTGPAASENGLQAFGNWVLTALEQHADGAAEAARSMIAALRQRDWEGDDVWADQLDALLGSGAMPDLRPLPVDLDELAGILEGDPMYGGGRVDLATGEIWPALTIDYAQEIGQEDEDESDDPDKWLWVHCEGSRVLAAQGACPPGLLGAGRVRELDCCGCGGLLIRSEGAGPGYLYRLGGCPSHGRSLAGMNGGLIFTYVQCLIGNIDARRKEAESGAAAGRSAAPGR